MVPQSKGKMFLSDERGCSELEWFRSCHTFNFGKYRHEHKTPFGALYVLNEDTLAEGARISMEVETDSAIVLIPVVGTIAWKAGPVHEGMVEAGQAQVLQAPAGVSVQIANPYEDTPVKYLQLWIKTNGGPATAGSRLFPFDLEASPNKLVEAFGPLWDILSATHTGFAGAIGKFAGREETVYKMKNPANGLFAFVLQGAFEVQYRLLHAGDGLGLWDLPEIELEALSNDAIILLLEVSV